MDVNPVNVNLLHASVLIGELAKYGARRAVISPGSRSAPLAVAAHSFPGLKTYTILDERSAAFFALGLSKADGKPVILICTSGTAAANYFPAVIEASRWGVLLVVLTADRPAALRQTGAPQTIDQTHLYGNFVRFFADVPEAKLDIERCRAVQSIAAEACAAATGSNPGPVHLNVPLDEPLAPIPESATEVKRLWTALRDEATERPAPRIETEPPEGAMRPVRQLVTESLCGLIVAGPGAASSFEEAEPIFHLARKLGWPLLADVVSGVRLFDEPVAPFYDFFLRTEELAALAPDVVLHLGGFPTSKMLAQYLDRHRAAQTFRIGRSFQAGDPLFREGMFIESSPAIFCRELAKRLGPSRDSLLLEPFQRASRLVSEELEHVTRESNDDCEALVTLAALNALKEEWNIVLASSLPVRYGDALFATQGRLHRVYGLRGVNGIDGTLSHAAGIATASGRPTLLVTGDLALVHDLTGLIAALKYAPNLTILLLDNNGGGIFHFLPVRDHEDKTLFETIHGTPHHLNLAGAGSLFGVDWIPVGRASEIAVHLQSTPKRARVLHVQSSRERNYAAYSALIERLKRASVR